MLIRLTVKGKLLEVCGEEVSYNAFGNVDISKLHPTDRDLIIAVERDPADIEAKARKVKHGEA